MLISRRLLDVAHRLDELRTAAPETGVEPPIVPIESLGYEPDTDVVPIASLAPDEPQDSAAAPGIEASFRTFELLIRQRGPAAPSLEGLLGQASAEPEVGAGRHCSSHVPWSRRPRACSRPCATRSQPSFLERQASNRCSRCSRNCSTSCRWRLSSPDPAQRGLLRRSLPALIGIAVSVGAPRVGAARCEFIRRTGSRAHRPPRRTSPVPSFSRRSHSHFVWYAGVCCCATSKGRRTPPVPSGMPLLSGSPPTTCYLCAQESWFGPTRPPDSHRPASRR